MCLDILKEFLKKITEKQDDTEKTVVQFVSEPEPEPVLEKIPHKSNHCGCIIL